MINKKKLIVLFTCVLTTTIIATILNIVINYNDLTSKWMGNSLDEAKAISKNLQFVFDKEISENELMSDIITRDDLTKESKEQFINSIYKDNYSYGIGYIDENSNNQISFTKTSDTIIDQNFINKNNIAGMVQEARLNRRTVVSHAIKLSDHSFGIIMISPVYSKYSEFKGAVYRIANIDFMVDNLIVKNNAIEGRDYFIVSSDGTWIYSQAAAALVGKNYKDVMDKSKDSIPYNNYTRIVKGEEFAGEHRSLRPDGNKGILDYKNSVISVSPLKVNGKYIFSVGVTVPTSQFSFMKKALVYEMLIFVLFTFAVVATLYFIHKASVKVQKESVVLQEKLKHVEDINMLNKQIQKNNYEVIKVLVKLIEMKDNYTKGHSERVTEYAVGLGKYLGMSKQQVNSLKLGAILHDIGKIGVPEEILNKKGRLTEDEYKKIKEHPVIGYNALKDMDFLQNELEIILHHHERIDGKGYPEGLTGDQISESSKILAICDSFDAMTSFRAYKRNLSFSEAFEELRRFSDTQFDAYYAEKFIEFIEKEYELDEETKVM